MDKFEVHYYLRGDSHSMDAFVKNKAEFELLKMLKEVSNLLDLELDFEFEANAEGGIKDFINIIKNHPKKKQIIRILAGLGIIFSGVVTNIISDNIGRDREFEALQKEEIKLHIKKLKKDLENDEIQEEDEKIIIHNLTIILTNSDKIKHHKSRFYTELLKEPKIEKFSTTELDNNYNATSQEYVINRGDFQSFIIDKIPLESQYYKKVLLEVVSPVLNNGKMKWKGVFNSEPISFNLKDSLFKKQVINREFSFSNGTYIECDVEIEKELDDDGEEKIIDINVYDVNNVVDAGITMLTQKGKTDNEVKRQLKLDLE